MISRIQNLLRIWSAWGSRSDSIACHASPLKQSGWLLGPSTGTSTLACNAIITFNVQAYKFVLVDEKILTTFTTAGIIIRLQRIAFLTKNRRNDEKLAVVTKILICGKILDDICTFWRTKNGILGGKILWSLIIIVIGRRIFTVANLQRLSSIIQCLNCACPPDEDPNAQHSSVCF